MSETTNDGTVTEPVVPAAPGPAAEPVAAPAPTQATDPGIASAQADASEQANVEGQVTEEAKPDGPKPYTETATLLEGIGEKGEHADPKPAEAQQQPKPVYQEFTFPEGVTADKERLGQYTELLGQHGIAQEAGQALLDMHTGAMQSYAEHLIAEQHRVFGETRANWRTEVMADDQLGGAGHQTTMAAVARMRDLLVPENRKDAFNQMLRVTGVGDHPEFLRLLHNAARYFDEPTAPAHIGRPPPDNGRQPGRAGSRAMMYDHPRSHINRN